MARRIDIELTSARPDGTWTWRAAGALQPRGVLDGGLLYHGAKAGDIVRADAEFEIDGITVIGVLPPKKKRGEPERLELIGPTTSPTPGVTTSLVSRAGRGPGGARHDRDGERGGTRPPRRDGAPPDRRAERPGRPSGDRPPKADSPARRDARGDRPPTDGEAARTGPREKPAGRDREQPPRRGGPRDKPAREGRPPASEGKAAKGRR